MYRKKVKKSFNKYKKELFNVIQMNELKVLPGNIAFFFVLALIPMMTIAISIFSDYVSSLIEIIQEIFPGGTSTMIINVVSSRRGTSLTFNLLALFIASNGTYAIVNAANTLYGVNNRDFIKDRVKSIVLLFLIIVLLAFLILVPMFGGIILSFFNKYSFYSKIIAIYYLLKWPLTIFLIYIVLKIMYTISPSKSIKSKSTTRGAIFTTTIWTIATAMFGFYLQNFANYNELYGNLANIVILMIWLYIISYVFVLGMAINSVDYRTE